MVCTLTFNHGLIASHYFCADTLSTVLHQTKIHHFAYWCYQFSRTVTQINTQGPAGRAHRNHATSASQLSLRTPPRRWRGTVWILKRVENVPNLKVKCASEDNSCFPPYNFGVTRICPAGQRRLQSFFPKSVRSFCVFLFTILGKIGTAKIVKSLVCI